VTFTFRHGDRPLEGYTIQRAVGRGGFGEVYYAVSDGGREVALKYLRDNPTIELRGVSHCMNLKSPFLVKIFDVRKNGEGEHFIIMEYVDGPSLRDILIAEADGLGPQKAAFFIREIAKGLGYLHERGIVHRDMKPGNIFYDEGYVKIGDYGLSKFISVSQHSAQTASVGTVHYMAPEVGSGNYHRGIDIYALGVMLYEMLLGRLPYEGSTMAEVLMKHLTAQPVVDELPAPFGDVIRQALAKDPKDRYQTVDEMAEALLGVDAVKQSLVGFDTMTLTNVVRRAVPDVGVHSPAPSAGPPPPAAHFVDPDHPHGTGVGGAIRDLADAAGDALKAAAAGRPHGSAPGEPLQLSPEAASGHMRYAGFWLRCLAAFIDVMIVGIPCALIGLNKGTGGLLLLYQAILVGTWNGQTLGKRACGIKIISADGYPCTLGQAFGRALAKILSVFIFLIGYLMIPFDHQKRALHDRVAGTLHVYAV
jgi:uncharacterized RDD family membrane protein YckC